MINNDVLRRLRFALQLTDDEVRRLSGLVGVGLAEEELRSYLAREGEPDFLPCPDRALEACLDGLVLHRRGPRDGAPLPATRFDNNMILKKLRIALELKEVEMLRLLKLGGMDLSPSELAGLFRTRTHQHYRACGDQLLRNFLKGLTAERRGVGAAGPDGARSP